MSDLNSLQSENEFLSLQTQYNLFLAQVKLRYLLSESFFLSRTELQVDFLRKSQQSDLFFLSGQSFVKSDLLFLSGQNYVQSDPQQRLVKLKVGGRAKVFRQGFQHTVLNLCLKWNRVSNMVNNMYVYKMLCSILAFFLFELIYFLFTFTLRNEFL